MKKSAFKSVKVTRQKEQMIMIGLDQKLYMLSFILISWLIGNWSVTEVEMASALVSSIS